MSIILEILQQRKQLENKINGFFKSANAAEHLSGVGAYRIKGVPVMQIMLYLVGLVFTKKSMYMNIRNNTDNPGFGKDVVCRFLNSSFINWSAYLLKLAMSVIAPIKVATSDDRICALVVDDSLFERGRSKNVELLANVYDHAEKGKNKFKRGFRI